MAVRGQEEVGVDERREVGRRVDGRPLGARRWGDPVTVGPCPAIAVPMAVVRLTPKPDVMVAVIAKDAHHGTVAGNSREGGIDPVIASLSGLGIVSVIEQVIRPVIDLESALVIARESGSVIGLVHLNEIRTPPVRNFKTTAQVPDVFAIGTIVMATAVAPGMNDVNRPSGPDPVTKRAVPSVRMQHRRLQRPHPQQTI